MEFKGFYWIYKDYFFILLSLILNHILNHTQNHNKAIATRAETNKKVSP